MKKIRRFLSLSIFCIMFLTTISFAEKINTAEVDVFFEIQTVGYESAYVDATEDDITIKINIDSSDFISDLDQIFIIAYNKIDVNEYNIEIFLEDNKIFTITAPREVINRYISGQINEELFLDTLTYQDERSREEKLKMDLEVLDMIVYGVKLNQNRCEVLLYYTGHDVAELIEDIPNMHLLVIEHAPWVEKNRIYN
ncbi:MAG: hypothetical protein LR001_10040 [Clostridiales bacterium]|nr:hypothetical protein [Clostridiales bacterium]